MNAIRTITEHNVAINVSGSVQTTVSAVTAATHKKIDLGPLFHNIIHHQYYSSCIIAQPGPLTLLSPPLLNFDLV